MILFEKISSECYSSESFKGSSLYIFPSANIKSSSVGSSLKDIRLAKKINLTVTQRYYQTYDINSIIGDLAEHSYGAEFVNGIRKMSQSRVSMEGLSEVEKEAAIKQ